MMMALATMATMSFAPTQNSSAASTHRFTSDTSMEAFRTSACDAAAFPLDLGDTQCHGLGKKAANTSAECCAACVGDAHCETWNWCEPDGRGCDAKQKVAGCWVGKANACKNSSEGWVSRARPPPPERRGFVSYTLGDHMVLQRAPQQAVIWGHTKPGATVTTKFDSVGTYTATAGADGVWRQKLPATAASKRAYTIAVSGSAGESQTLSDVLFGDVYLCGGQSNMQISMGAIENSTTEIAKADGFPTVRLFTVGQDTESAHALHDLQTIEQNWSVASSKTVAGNGGFGYFSAVCWEFGTTISAALSPTGDVPIGLVSNNWGRTPVEKWSDYTSFAACNRSAEGASNGTLYNAMIHPYVVGPMALTGFTWYQGEANTRDQASADAYGCLFPAMIETWRARFEVPTAYFGYVQLSTRCAGGIPEMRRAQMEALRLPMVGYATNADHGAGCNIHPPPKQYCGARLGNSALALAYGDARPWKSPSFKSAECTVPGGPPPPPGPPPGATVRVSVTLSDVVGPLTLDVYPANYLGGTFNCSANPGGTCAWAAVELIGSKSNASMSTDGQKLVLTAVTPAQPAAVNVSYAWGPVPMMNAYDTKTGLPVLPFREEVVCRSLPRRVGSPPSD